MADSYQLEVAELQAIVNRDADAFCRWFSRSDLRIRLSLRGFADVVDVEALVQDAALQIWKEPSRIVPDGRSGFLRRYATTVALNAARNAATRAGRERAPLSLRDLDRPDGRPLADPMLRGRIHKCMARLAGNPRRALLACVENGKSRSGREVAAEIQMGFDAFRQNLARARASLVLCLKAFQVDVMEYLR